jgi:hypothetical protein
MKPRAEKSGALAHFDDVPLVQTTFYNDLLKCRGFKVL